MPKELSIVIPAYNERQRLPRYFDEICEYADHELPADYEVLVVDDGSTDGTWEWLQETARSCRALRAIQLPKNQGKGAAVRTGVLAAQGRKILFTDADGATPIAEERQLRQRLNAGADLAIGVRVEAESNRCERTWHRRVQGEMFCWMVRQIVGVQTADSQCGFKMIQAEVGKAVYAGLQENGFLFDVELLMEAARLGMSICEVPVNWSEIPGSKVHPIRDTVKMGVGLFKLRRRAA